MKNIILLTFILVFQSFPLFGNPNEKGVVCKCIKCNLNSIFIGTYLSEKKPTEIGFLFKNNVVNIFTIGRKNDEIYYDKFEGNKKFRFRVTNEKIIWNYYKYRTFTLNRKELKLYNDYRKKTDEKKQRIFYPLNEKTLFSINQLFRRLTRDIDKSEKTFITKGRKFYIHDFYNGISKFTFEELCDKNLGSEDYLNLANICDHIFIYNVPSFTELNSNQQLRFINLIDVLYDKKIKLTLSLETRLEKLNSSKRHYDIFKRTISRLHEMTKVKNY